MGHVDKHCKKSMFNMKFRDLPRKNLEKIYVACFILRMIPILGTYKAYDKSIEKLGDKIMLIIFKEGTEMTYYILFKTKNNNNISRDETIQFIGGLVKSQAGKTSVDLKNPDIIRTLRGSSRNKTRSGASKTGGSVNETPLKEYPRERFRW